MSIRDELIEKVSTNVEVGNSASQLLNKYKNNLEVHDDVYDLYNLYALLRIMTYVKRCAYVVARKNMRYFYNKEAQHSFIMYNSYIEDYKTAYDEFIKHFTLEQEEVEYLSDVREKLGIATMLRYDNDIDFLIDVFDLNSALYTIEGVSYAK